MSVARTLTVLLLLVAVAAGFGTVIQHAETSALRGELAIVRGHQQDLAEARAEKTRLKAAQPSAAELASLRADHAAMERLRSELNTLRESIRTAEAAARE